ncbi:hypothetical protein [Polycladidibacter hongkongensis]|uniref:hypothetical protein n=1 Tax=Polycladidibacter hongkongensis TaxID=1647556 RepID=UPI00082B67BA|nr:hypothetical protein [Pseudovibrio hongkongensis]
MQTYRFCSAAPCRIGGRWLKDGDEVRLGDEAAQHLLLLGLIQRAPQPDAEGPATAARKRKPQR